MRRTLSLHCASPCTLALLAAWVLLACGADTHPLDSAAGSAGTGDRGGSAGVGENGASAGIAGTAGGSAAGTGGSAGDGSGSSGTGASAGQGGSAMAGGSMAGGSAGIGTVGGSAGTAMAGSSGAFAGGAGTAGTAGADIAAGAGGMGGDSAGVGAGGSAGSGATTGVGGSAGTVGCGVTGSPGSGTYPIDVDGLEREFNIKLPADYDPSVPYRLIFAWHWLTGTAARVQSAGYYGLESRSAGTTIFVAGQGLDSNGDMEYGWPNTNGRDVAFARALLEWVRTRYCIDSERIFSTGWSYGGMFSNRLGCEMGDVFRAIAPMSGSGPSRSGCVGQVAAWISHGDQDPTVSLGSGEASRDHWAQANHCSTETMPTEPSPCVAYQGCDGGFPVHWCVFPGGHMQPSFGSSAIWDFFSQL